MLGAVATSFKTALSYPLANLMIQSEYGSHHFGLNPPCVIQGYGQDHIWSLWPYGPKVKMEVLVS